MPRSEKCSVVRQKMAEMTVITATPTIACDHLVPASVPVPSPWMTAIGNSA
jgi:hypothetical protein